MLSATPPKLQRIPRPGEKQIMPNISIIPKNNDSNNTQNKVYRISKFTTVPQYVKVSETNPAVSEPAKSIVGAVTTWFPPSSKIQLNSNNSPPKNSTESVQSPRPQSITIMGDRKFLIIPKHNILSVSPTIGAAVNTPSSRPINSPTADKAPIPTNPDDQNETAADSTVDAVQVSAYLDPENPVPASSTCSDPSGLPEASSSGENELEQLNESPELDNE